MEHNELAAPPVSKTVRTNRLKDMASSYRRFVLSVVGCIVAALSLAAGLRALSAPQFVRSLPVVASRPIDPIVTRLLAQHCDAHVLRAIAVDVDKDGDLDVIGLTPDATVELWINDGSGHFTRETPRTATSIASSRGLAQSIPADSFPGAPATSKWWYALARGRAFVAPEPIRLAHVPAVVLRASGSVLADRPTRAPPAVVRSI